MKTHVCLAAALALVSSACCHVNQGKVVAKGAHLGSRAVHTSAGLNSRLAPGRDPLFRAPLPDVHWIKVESTDKNGKTERCNVILFEKDWAKIALGDCWSRDGVCGAASGKECTPPDSSHKEYKAPMPRVETAGLRRSADPATSTPHLVSRRADGGASHANIVQRHPERLGTSTLAKRPVRERQLQATQKSLLVAIERNVPVTIAAANGEQHVITRSNFVAFTKSHDSVAISTNDGRLRVVPLVDLRFLPLDSGAKLSQWKAPSPVPASTRHRTTQG